MTAQPAQPLLPRSPLPNLPLPRLGSIDAYRGLVMFLMMAEVLRLAAVSAKVPDSWLLKFLAQNLGAVCGGPVAARPFARCRSATESLGRRVRQGCLEKSFYMKVQAVIALWPILYTLGGGQYGPRGF